MYFGVFSVPTTPAPAISSQSHPTTHASSLIVCEVSFLWVFWHIRGGGGDEGLGVSEKVRRGLEGVQGVRGEIERGD